MIKEQPLSNAAFAILSLVAEKPRHGYEIEQVIVARGMREWTEIGFSSIYYLLNKLESQQLLEAHLDPPSGRGPARKMYQLLPAGGRALKQAVVQALGQPGTPQNALLLGLANLPLVEPDQAIEALREYNHILEQRIQGLRAKQAAGQPLPFFVEALFDYSLTLARAEQDWIRRFITDLEQRDGSEN